MEAILNVFFVKQYKLNLHLNTFFLYDVQYMYMCRF